MLPDADWKTEDQSGARARTSDGNNEGDIQGNDTCMPSWMFKKASNREETKKPAKFKKNDN